MKATTTDLNDLSTEMSMLSQLISSLACAFSDADGSGSLPSQSTVESTLHGLSNYVQRLADDLEAYDSSECSNNSPIANMTGGSIGSISSLIPEDASNIERIYYQLEELGCPIPESDAKKKMVADLTDYYCRTTNPSNRDKGIFQTMAYDMATESERAGFVHGVKYGLSLMK